MKRIILILSMSLLLVLSGCEGEKSKEEIKALPTDVATEKFEEKTQSEEISPNGFDLSKLSAEDLEGESVDNSIFSEKYTLINVWGTFCGPCLVEIPHLAQLYEDYKDQGFNVVGIVGDAYQQEKIEDKAKEIVAMENVEYKNLVINDYLIENLMTDIQYFPTSFIVDENGKQVGELIIGAKNYEYFSKIFEDLKQNI